MKSTTVTGLFMTQLTVIPEPKTITLKAETTNGFSTISLSDDERGIMIQIPITLPVKHILRGVTK